MSKRKSLTKKTRFEVFKRDAFTCQYCGQKAPDVILEVDHIEPVSKGGTNDLMNLITSCKACNRGKSNRRLDDNTVLEKQRNELELLNERRNQIDMLLQWKKELLNQKDYVLENIKSYWNALTDTEIIETGEATLKKLVKKYSIDEILEAMEESYETYNYEAEKAYQMLPGVLRNLERFKENPELKDIYYCRGILRNRIYVNERNVMEILMDLSEVMDIEELKELCKTVKNWTKLRELWNEKAWWK